MTHKHAFIEEPSGFAECACGAIRDLDGNVWEDQGELGSDPELIDRDSDVGQVIE